MRPVLLLIALLLFISTTGHAQTYEIQWEGQEHIPYQRDLPGLDAPVAPQPRTTVHPPSFTDRTPIWGYRNRWLKPNVQETYEVQLQATAYFNHDIEAYHAVDVIELTTVRDGREEFRVVDNAASHTRLTVSLPNLQQGDAYRAKIFWVDGSYRTVESVINVYADIRPIVDEPDFLAPPYW